MQKEDFKILLIQYRPAGDVLLLTSVVKAIKERYPRSSITFMVNEKESGLIRDFPLIDDFILLKTMKKEGVSGFLKYLTYNLGIFLIALKSSYDVVIDFIGNPTSAIFTFLTRAPMRIGRNLRLRRVAYNIVVPAYHEGMNTVEKRLSHLRPLDIDALYVSPEVFFSEGESAFADEYIESLGIEPDRKILFLAPNSPRSSRKWKREYFVLIGKWLIEKYNAKILLAWGPGEEEYTETITREIGKDAEMIPLTSLKEMAAIISRSGLMITNDSGPKHIANAVGVPTITIYGPTDPGNWNHPDWKANPVLRADVPCIQCERNVCNRERHFCMEGVTPNEVMRAVESVFG